VRQTAGAPLRLEVVPAVPDPSDVLDAALGIVAGSIGVGLAVLRKVGRPVLMSRAVWRPAFLPESLQPATLVTEVARRGARHRALTVAQVASLLDRWTPELVEQVVSRVDLTSLVIRHVDVDGVVGAVDLVSVVEQVLAEIDLPEIIRDSTGSMASETVRGARLTGISADEAVSRAVARHLFRRRGAPPGAAGP
jgi:hypothetical protein